MAKGDATAKQAKTGYNFRFYYEKLAANASSASTPDDVTFVEIEGMKSGALPSPEKPDIDVTTTTDEVKAYISGIPSMNDLSLEFNFYPQNEVHQDLVQNVIFDSEPRWWKITGQGMVYTFLANLKSNSTSFAVDTALTMPLTLKVANKPVVEFGAVSGADTMRGFAAQKIVA